jgi:hypothetical protein
MGRLQAQSSVQPKTFLTGFRRWPKTRFQFRSAGGPLSDYSCVMFSHGSSRMLSAFDRTMILRILRRPSPRAPRQRLTIDPRRPPWAGACGRSQLVTQG